MEITRPVFIIGCPRSGTTVISEIISSHPDAAWFSNYSEWFPLLPWFNLMRRIIDIPIFGPLLQGRKGVSLPLRFLPRPSEAWSVWEYCCGKKILYEPLTNVDPTPTERHRLRKMVKQTLFFQGGKQLVTKMTGPPRIKYLRKIFPDAAFIHIIRDGRAVVHSLLNVNFWKKGGGYEKPWWGGFPKKYEEQWLATEKSPIALAALQWRYIIELTEVERNEVGSDFLEIKYEDFLENPTRVVGKMLDFCRLSSHKRVWLFLQRTPLRDTRLKWRRAFTEQEQHLLQQLIGDILKRYGYS